ncbi:unnamed protein product [Thlaspi arvense]|uniref:RRM domain-containing protein n=1 Tax=Thlaspi arvense TaxID=13288 RepID=A0AAU9SET8_THLAR|nr:unnamed protein product [Thlaspi arvense]
MDGSAMKDDMELNDLRKSSSMISRIYVEGYDTWLSGDDVVAALREHFASCGEVIHVFLPGYVRLKTRRPRRLNRFALMYIRGDGAEEKALKLSGKYMGGHKVVTKAYPFHAKHLDHMFDRTRDVDGGLGRSMLVTGYDTSLCESDATRTLIRHFSKCGLVRTAHVQKKRKGVLESEALVTLHGQYAIEKALQLGGCDEKGFENVEVSRVFLPDPPGPGNNTAGFNSNGPYKRMKREEE